MRNTLNLLVTATFLAVPVFAGALTLQVDDLKSNPEAVAKNAAVVAHITACRSPEKTAVTATAEGIVNGKRQTLPLRVVNLSEPGAFAVTHEWPRESIWTVKMIATNPDYKDFATSVVIPIQNDMARPATSRVFYHAPAAEEVNSVLKQATL
ncbi:MAG TPA: hypothetical protein VFC21_04950 [Bryobacteraceae bacterium]|nr:hypothetical protein [Bryobacteraceae bacterium]